MAAGGVVLTVGLIIVGKFVNAEGESLRDTAREARQERREMFNMALQQQQAAQNIVFSSAIARAYRQSAQRSTF